jgi:hypothetical protein
MGMVAKVCGRTLAVVDQAGNSSALKLVNGMGKNAEVAG